MSDKRLAQTVIDGNILTAHTKSSSLPEVRGYLAGSDSYHWLLVTPACEPIMVHKTDASPLAIGEASYASEPKHDALEEIIAPYREALLSKYRDKVQPDVHVQSDSMEA